MSDLNLKKTKSKKSKSSFSKSFREKSDYDIDYNEKDLQAQVTYEDI